ncbi:Carboxypeptidase regulatory-like domain-containing protein [Micromonospora pallida]|uniref:Carboxypeptidase regulatory-like domain-containing protein n=1 Tax=Micromonospora pallida TaxID=145854 RepID=A0A1C6RPE8_9ACTN|nr:carboxypeptidase-like regulatory domain-containing protein [Micromonospora pallida]SCL19062.1 Carboxypeptidase regulatory-like domain-containing protein [Micromonospora pallida]
MRKHLGPLGLSLVVLGALLTGCQGDTGPTGTPAPATGSPNQPVSDRPNEPDDDPSPDLDDDLPGNRGVVSGRVRTPSGAAVVGAAVRVRSLDTPPVPVPELVVTTDDDGYFRWQLAPGRYEVSVAPADGSAPITASAVDVRAGAERTIDITVR